MFDNHGKSIVTTDLTADDNTIYRKPDLPAQYPGGKSGWNNHLKKTLRYPVEARYESQQLFGSWKESQRLPTPPLLSTIHTLSQLEISKEFFISKRFERDQHNSWQLTNDGKAIYLDGKSMVSWKILSLSDTTLVLQQISSFPGDNTTITYSRISGIDTR